MNNRFESAASTYAMTVVPKKQQNEEKRGTSRSFAMIPQVESAEEKKEEKGGAW